MMYFDVSGRRSGKTARMLDWAEEAPEGEHRVIVSATERQAMSLLRRSREEGRSLESWQFVSLGEVKGTRAFSGVLVGRGGRIVLGLDDLNLMLVHMIPFEVRRVSAAR